MDQIHIKRAMEILMIKIPDDRCMHLATSLQKMKNAYKRHENYKKSRTIVILEEAPKIVHQARHTVNICEAFTMKGTKCTFKAVNGCYCKKHSLSTGKPVLGKKVVI